MFWKQKYILVLLIYIFDINKKLHYQLQDSCSVYIPYVINKTYSHAYEIYKYKLKITQKEPIIIKIL